MEIRTIADYPPPRLEPFCYPGRRPEYSFTTMPDCSVLPIYPELDDEGVYASGMSWGVQTPEGLVSLDAMLADHGVSTIGERIPVLAFGSNANPGQLIEKFKEASSHVVTHANDRLIVPTLKGRIRDHVVAYSSKLGTRGYFFAELMARPGAETETFINFLSPRQLEMMRLSEGAYHFCEVGAAEVDGLQRPLDVYGFAGKNNVLLDEKGQPILLDAVETTADLPRMNQIEVLASVSLDVGNAIESSYAILPAPVNTRSEAGSDEQNMRIRGERLGTLMTYRTNFIVRPNTSKTQYAYNPQEGQRDEALYGTVIMDALRAQGRVAANNLLSTIPEHKRDIQDAKTLNSLYNR